jgi:PAS domain S-box-containing protein
MGARVELNLSAKEVDRRDHIWFLESLDRLNRAMQGTNDVEQMMSHVLEAALEIFACDRAWLIYPCVPEAPAWRVVMEQTRPQFPGLYALGTPQPMDANSANVFRLLRDSRGAVLFGPGHDQPMPPVAQKFDVHSQMLMTLFPKGDQPYVFGLHHCSERRAWSAQEKRLFEETGYRLTDALTSVLMFRNLRDSERRLDEAQRMAHLGYWDRDIETGVVTVSEEACSFFGFPLDERTFEVGDFYKRWLTRIHPEDWPRVAAALAAVLRGDTRYDVEYRVLRPDGSTLILQSRAELKKDEAGTPKRLFGMSMNVTDLRQAEDALRASEARFRTLVEHATDAFILLDDQLTVIDVNDQACRNLGYSREELIGMHPPDFTIPDGCEVPDLGPRLLAGETVTFETRHRRKDGTVFPVEIRSSHFNQQGSRFLSIVRDITDRKRAEEERRQHIWFLESLDRVNRAIQGTNDPERLMRDVLDVVLDVFQPDVAALSQFAGTPPVITVTISAFRERPGASRTVTAGGQFPVNEDDEVMYRALAAASGPLQFHRAAGNRSYDRALERFQLQSSMTMKLLTKLPDGEHVYHFSLAHQTSPRVWMPQEVRLFEEVGRRLGDAISAVSTLQSLRQSEARLAEAQRIAHLGHWEWDVDTDRFTCSEEAAAVLGLRYDERPTTFAGFAERFDPADDEMSIRNQWLMLAGGSPIEFEHRVMRPGGYMRLVHVRGTRIKRDSQTVRQVFGTIQDVTERKQAEADLHAAENRFRTFVDHATDALFVFEAGNEKLIDVNRQACQSLGFTREELLGMKPPDIDPSIRPEDIARVREQLLTGQTVTFETVHQRKDGTRFPVEMRIRPFFHQGSRFGLGLARDITDRKRAEQQRERMLVLESERESAVANERNRLAGEIHDTLAQGLATIVMQLADAEARLGAMWLYAEKPLNTVRELAIESLAYARRSLNMLRPGVAASGLTRAVRHIAEATRRHLGASITVTTEGESLGLPAAVESALISIAREALTNAARHARAPNIRVQIAFVDGNAVQVVVADNGIGFDPGRVSPDSFGLVNMRERSGRAGIALTVVTEPGVGTEIVARWSP